MFTGNGDHGWDVFFAFNRGYGVKFSLYQTTALTVLMALTVAGAAQAEDSFSGALAASKPIVESNLRSEQVDQQGFAEKADALTWRNRIGIQTGEVHHLKFLVEFENVTALTSDYNSTTNGKTTYPVVSDPEVTELNRAQIVWSPTAATTLTAGRQRVILDDGRFIGNVGWRQDEQTMDGIRLDSGIGKLKYSVAYLSKINRVLAESKDWNSDSWVVNASYAFNDRLKLTAFDYALDFDNAAASSTNTWGLRATGAAKAGALKLTYIGQYASQSDYGNNPADFDLQEYMVEAGATYGLATFKVNYESLGGNGSVGFVTPLGTNHAFQGFSDAFSGTGGNKTTVNGIDDLNYSLSLALPVKLKPTLSLVYHDLTTARLDQKLGQEWDAVATIVLTPHLSALVKYADFDSAGGSAPASRRKTWVALQYKL